MRKNFRQLSDPIDADPVRRARVEEYERAMLDAVALAELREAESGELPSSTALPPAQENGSYTERQDDPYLATLSSSIAELGGRLEVTAVFPERTIALVASEAERAKAEP